MRAQSGSNNVPNSLTRFDKVAFETIYKCVEIIHRAREPFGYRRDNGSKTNDKLFFDLSEDNNVRKNLESFISTDCLLCVEVYWRNNGIDSSDKGLLLESWPIQYQAYSGKNNSPRSLPEEKVRQMLSKTYSEASIMLRSLHALVRLIPTHEFLRGVSMNDGTIDVRVKQKPTSDHTSNPNHTFLSSTSLAAVATAFGWLKVQVRYQNNSKDLISRVTSNRQLIDGAAPLLESNVIITDYVRKPVHEKKEDSNLRKAFESQSGVNASNSASVPVRSSNTNNRFDGNGYYVQQSSSYDPYQEQRYMSSRSGSISSSVGSQPIPVPGPRYSVSANPNILVTMPLTTSNQHQLYQQETEVFNQHARSLQETGLSFPSNLQSDYNPNLNDVYSNSFENSPAANGRYSRRQPSLESRSLDSQGMHYMDVYPGGLRQVAAQHEAISEQRLSSYEANNGYMMRLSASSRQKANNNSINYNNSAGNNDESATHMFPGGNSLSPGDTMRKASFSARISDFDYSNRSIPIPYANVNIPNPNNINTAPSSASSTQSAGGTGYTNVRSHSIPHQPSTTPTLSGSHQATPPWTSTPPFSRLRNAMPPAPAFTLGSPMLESGSPFLSKSPQTMPGMLVGAQDSISNSISNSNYNNINNQNANRGLNSATGSTDHSRRFSNGILIFGAANNNHGSSNSYQPTGFTQSQTINPNNRPKDNFVSQKNSNIYGTKSLYDSIGGAGNLDLQLPPDPFVAKKAGSTQVGIRIVSSTNINAEYSKESAESDSSLVSETLPFAIFSASIADNSSLAARNAPSQQLSSSAAPLGTGFGQGLQNINSANPVGNASSNVRNGYVDTRERTGSNNLTIDEKMKSLFEFDCQIQESPYEYR